MKQSAPLILLALAACCGCDLSSTAATSRRNLDSGETPRPFSFTEATAESGIDFRHQHGGSGRHYYLETMAAGCAFLDYDRDGWQDALLLQGSALPGFQPAGPLENALFRNQGNGRFVSLAKQAGLSESRYSIGCCAGDYDNDGFADIFITNEQGNSLYRNNGDGTYSEIAGAWSSGQSMCTSAGFVDYDHDGRLDLFICRYMDYVLADNPACNDANGRLAYCSPHVYRPTRCRLYHNEGDGGFADVSESSGVAGAIARGMGIACADYNEDGWIDLFVSSDLHQNLLFVNNGDGTLREEGALAGVAFGDQGKARAGMGVDAADYDNDGHIDLVVTNFANEPNAVYRNIEAGLFTEATMACGVGGASLPFVGWGCRFVDFDLDGRLDLFVVNGHVNDYADEDADGKGYSQTALIYRNEGAGRFSDVAATAGEFFSGKQVARGAAFGDYDNDGDQDVLIGCNNQPARLLRNDTRHNHHWVRLTLVGDGCNRDGLGARVRVTAGEVVQTQFARSACSYLSDHDRRLVFGLGEADEASIEIVWPCGAVQRIDAARGDVTVGEASCKGPRTPGIPSQPMARSE